MELTVERHGIPLPRPKPARDETGKVIAEPMNPAEERAFETTRAGRLEVSIERLGRERDPYKAADLQPNENSTWTSTSVSEARRRCALVLAATNVDAKPVDPIGGPGGCGVAAPIRVSSFGAVQVKPPATLNCTMAAAVYNWLTDVVQPEARKRFKQPVVSIRQISAYFCRKRRTNLSVRISEHSFGNALDIANFELASGAKISVLGDWSNGVGAFFGMDKQAAFLTNVHGGACKRFSTVLGPLADKAHANHFHIDLGRSGRYKFCK